MPTKKHYKAFISYSHDNEEFGAWLHKQLERYKIPKRLREDYPHLPKTLYPIFRDRYELRLLQRNKHQNSFMRFFIGKAIICRTSLANSKMINTVYGKPHKAQREASKRAIFTKYNP